VARPIIWNFHNARCSLAQSCLRELIARSVAPAGGASAWLAHLQSGINELAGTVPAGAPSAGLFPWHPAMQAAGMVLDQIHSGALADAGFARTAYQSHRATLPEARSAPGGLPAACLDLLAQHLIAWVLDDENRRNEIKSEFIDSNCDPGWLTAVAAWIAYYWNGKPPQYVPPAPGMVPFPLPPPSAPDGLLRVGIIADWGTGEPEAIAVLDQLMRQNPDLILHLGDIYYAGTHDECYANFLAPARAARQQHQRMIPVYTIPGNHDYYGGGTAFYAMLSQLNLGIPHASVQEHSFFCLQNDHWQLQCMDTGYNDHDLLRRADDVTSLQDVEAAWHQEQLKQAGARRVILVSHHQLYSAFTTIGRSGTSYQNPYLTRNLEAWRSAGATGIVGWLWGHEHLLQVYAVPAGSGAPLPVLGRCVGYGAFPVFENAGSDRPSPRSPIPLEPAPKFPNGYVQTGRDDQVYRNGFVVLTLGTASGTAAYFEVIYPGSTTTATSQLVWSEALPVAAR
jgi:3',5'-cyclic AMP phosphodiesterase CpdA